MTPRGKPEMTTTIARQARIRFADETAPLAQVVINAQAAAEAESLAADLIADIENYLAQPQEAVEFDYDCQMCGEGVDEVFCRLTEDGDKVKACETCVDTYNLGYAAE